MQSFQQFDFVAPIDRALEEMDFQHPTPIQQEAIPAAMEGRDVLGCAQTGTGKTAAFVLPILNHLAVNKTKPARGSATSLILAPTRELAVQIGTCIENHARHLRIRHTLVYGGVGQRPQVSAIRQGVHILVATPGRLLDLMNQGHVNLGRLEFLALDEVDRMLDMGFLPDVRRIIKEIPEQRQSLFFSATLPAEVRKLTSELLDDPMFANVSPRKVTVKKIKQQIFLVEKKQKQSLLEDFLAEPSVQRAIVFAGTKRMANQIARKLSEKGVQSSAIHGNKSQRARQNALDAFQKRKIKILVATDVAARGIDIPEVSHVINFDMPREPESYVHRIGRTGRAGKSGEAITFCLPNEQRELRSIEKTIREKLFVDRTHFTPRDPEKSEDSQRRPNRKSGYKSRNGNRNQSSRNANGRSAKNPAGRNSSSQSGNSQRAEDRATNNRTNKNRANSNDGTDQRENRTANESNKVQTRKAVNKARQFEGSKPNSRKARRKRKSYGFQIRIDE